MSSAALILIAVGWYLASRNRAQSQDLELTLAINQWRKTLNRQEQLLDKGFSPAQIFHKLDEIEYQITHQLALIHTPRKYTLFHDKFEQIKTAGEEALRDLEFRKALEDLGFPIHPTCLLDRGVVQGYSDLPEGTIMRIKLIGHGEFESAYFPARLSGGVFKLILDPDIEANIFDAKATVAPFSQQPPEIRRWIEHKLSWDVPNPTESMESASNPDSLWQLEREIHQLLEARGFQQVQVSVLSSPENPGKYVIALESNDRDRRAVLTAIAQALYDESRKSSLNITRVCWRHADRTLWWTADQVREAFKVLRDTNDPQRCASFLELHASSVAVP